VLVDKDRVQCTTDSDCRARGPQLVGAVCQDSVCVPDPVWGCLGSVVWPKAAPGTYTLTIHLRDLVTGRPIPGVMARLCERLDTECRMPIGPDIAADGEANLFLPVRDGFDGYVELRAPDRMPGTYFIYPPIDGDRDIPLVPLMEQALVEQLAILNMRELRADRGHVLLGAYDCERKPQEGVHLNTPDSDELTSSFYVLGGIPKAGVNATDKSGRGGFINLRQGIVALTATLASDNRKIAAVPLFIRPGTITFTTIVPSP
jgi:hypothetical protein